MNRAGMWWMEYGSGTIALGKSKNHVETRRLRDALRRSTRTAHDALEAVPVLQAMRAPDTGLERWLIGYQVIATGYRHVERSLHANTHCSALGFDNALCGIAAAYDEDLAALGRDGLLMPVLLPDAPKIRGRSHAYGAAWCLSGSRHGARVLKAHAQARFGSRARPYIRALSLQTDLFNTRRDNGERSRIRDVPEAIDQAEAIAGGMETFDYFRALALRVQEAIDAA